jgi:hypothetical protein
MDYVWKEIPETNGRYAISIYGEVHDIEKNNFIKPHMSGVKRRNYPQVTLYIQELQNIYFALTGEELRIN